MGGEWWTPVHLDITRGVTDQYLPSAKGPQASVDNQRPDRLTTKSCHLIPSGED